MIFNLYLADINYPLNLSEIIYLLDFCYFLFIINYHSINQYLEIWDIIYDYLCFNRLIIPKVEYSMYLHLIFSNLLLISSFIIKISFFMKLI